MNIHEYQAKELLRKFGVAIPAGVPAMTVDEAVAAAKQLPGPLYVVKSQIHAGGRGKGKFKELGSDAKGGVRLAKSVDEVRAHAQEMLGNTLVTVQTGDAGKQVNRLYVTDGVDIGKEDHHDHRGPRRRLPIAPRPHDRQGAAAHRRSQQAVPGACKAAV